MNAIDYISLAAVGLSCYRGFRRGLAVEADRLVRMALALLAGTTLYGWLSEWLVRLLSLGEAFSETLGFAGITAGTWYGVRSLRKGLVALISSKAAPGVQAWGGAVAAGIKSLLALVAILTGVSLASWMPFHEKAAGSLLGRTLVHLTTSPTGE